MTVKTFDQRMNQLQWQPTAAPSQHVIDDVLRRSDSDTLQGEWIVAGVVLGILIGFGLKGTIVPGGPFGAHADGLGFVVGALSLCAAVLSICLTIPAIALYKTRPHLMRFSLCNTLMILVLLIS